jgi:hypothetical protein
VAVLPADGNTGSSLGGKKGGPPPLLVFPTQTRLDIDRQRRLIVLDREDIIAAVVEDLLAKVALAEDGVAGDDAAAHGQNAQQLQGRFVFVGLGIDAHLRQHGGGTDGVGGDQVMAGHRVVSTAAQGLAVQCDDGRLLVGQAVGDPACQGGLEGDDIESPEEEGVGGFGRCLATTEAEGLSEGKALVSAELGNGLIGLAASEHSENGQAENGGEGVADASAVSGVGDVCQDIKKGKRRRHSKASGFGLGFSPLPASRVPAKINY